MHNRTETLELFESLADLVWGWLADARRLGLGFSEDTISDLTALKIARQQSIQVKVKRVSKQRERHGGFDWMWVIRRPGASYEVYVVQAKKLKLDQSDAYSYGTLKYRAGTKYQIDALEGFCTLAGRETTILLLQQRRRRYSKGILELLPDKPFGRFPDGVHPRSLGSCEAGPRHLPHKK